MYEGIQDEGGEEDEVEGDERALQQLGAGCQRLIRILLPDLSGDMTPQDVGLTILKYLFGWTIGISLVTYLCVTIMLNPFVTGTLTMDIGHINFAGIGVTPTGIIDRKFFWDAFEVNIDILDKQANESIDNEKYKDWPKAAIEDLESVMDQVCGVQDQYMKVNNVYDFHISRLNRFRKNPKITKDNATDYLIGNYVIPDLLKGFTNCSTMITSCVWNNADANCSDHFHEFLTDGGISCVANTRPLPPSESNTIKGFLGFKYPTEDIAKWDKVDFDRYNEGKEKIKTSNPVLIQRIPGQSFGLTFSVKQDKSNIVCRNTLGYGFKLTLTNPRDIHQVKKYGRALPYGYEHFVHVIPEIKLIDNAARKKPIKTRKCCLDKECQDKENTTEAYSQANCISRCMVQFVLEACNCTTLYSFNSYGREFCNFNKLGCLTSALNKFYEPETESCPHCLPNCNEVFYHADVTSIPIPKDILENMNGYEGNTTDIAVVHVFYGVSKTEALVVKLRWFFNELLGIVSGMFGSSVEFTLLKFWDIMIILLGMSVTVFFFISRKCRKLRAPMSRCFAFFCRCCLNWRRDRDNAVVPFRMEYVP